MSSMPARYVALDAALQLPDPKERKKAAQRALNRILKALEPLRLRKKPGPKLERKAVRQATFRVMRRLFPADMGRGWIPLLKLTPKDMDALSPDVWKRTMEGRAVFEREGEEGLERYVTEQKLIYKTWKELHQMEDIYNLVEKEMGLLPRDGRMNPRGGKFRQWVREAQEEFFFSWAGMTWEVLPPHLRGKYRDADEFKQKLMEYQWTYCYIG